MTERGSALIEILVALVVFALVAAATAETLAVAHHARRSSELAMRATTLAGERLERLRAGDRSSDPAPLGPFTRSWRTAPAGSTPGLTRFDVTVAWEDGGPHELTLSALVRDGGA